MCNQYSITRQKLGNAMALPWWRSPVDQPTSIQTSDKYTEIRQVYNNQILYNNIVIIQ